MVTTSKLFGGWALAFLMTLALAAAADATEPVHMAEMVVTATRTEQDIDQVPSTVYVVDKKEIKEKQVWSLDDALRFVPGVSVRSNGNFAGPTSLTMRGGGDEQVRLMLDGVRLADPITPSGAFNLSMFDLGSVDSIEVVQGPQSTLYGSDAMSGAINIITRRGRGKPSAWAWAEGGSYDTLRGQVGFQGQEKKFNFFVSGSGITTNGISTAKDQPEKDPYRSYQFNTRLGYDLPAGGEVYLIGYFHRADADYDAFWSSPADSQDHVRNTAWTGIAGLRQNLTPWWDHDLKVSRGHNQRDYSDNSTYKSHLTSAQWQHNLHYGEISTTSLGVDWEQEEGEYDSPLYSDRMGSRTADLWGVFLQEQLTPLPGLVLIGGVRQDQHQEFGGKHTWKLGAAYLLAATGTRFKANYGTGFKAPTIYQLYSKFGNQSLQPEESRGWDVGLEQYLWAKKIKVGLTYFNMDTDQLILWDYDAWKYKNISQASSHGLEFSAKAHLTSWLALEGSYTYTHSESESSGNELAYVPKHKATLGLRLAPLDGLVVRVFGLYTGRRYADEENTEEVDGYTVWNLAASYRLSKRVQIMGKVVNLFDEDYEEIQGYGTMGLSGFLGVRVSL